jgi:cell division protease FtsH
MHARRRTERRTSNEGGRGHALVLAGLALPFLIGFYALVLGYWAHPASAGRQLRLDEFLTLVGNGQVSSATILSGDDRITGAFAGGAYWVDFPGGHESLFARLTGALEAGGVPTTVRRQPLKSLVGPVSTLLPVLILGDLIVIVTLLARSGAGPAGGFGRAGACQVGDGGSAVLTFADVAGADEAVEELAELVDYLAHPERFAAMGAAVPKGVLLSGPPGCGKTRLARAVAGESGVAFFSISGSDFVEMFVGVGAARIRDLFATAAAAAPAIVFIDEIDALGRTRSATVSGGSDEREATLNQLLVAMDGFAAGSGVVVMAATNRPDMLDPALLRPGRFDRHITVDPPDLVGREAVLALHCRDKPLADGLDLRWVARRTVGFSGAELANVVNEAALLATRRGSDDIGVAQFSEAVERVVAGPERRSRVLSPADRHRIAVHEAGHAVSAAALPGADAVAKVSIVARGHGGGFTWYTAQADQVLATRGQLTDRLVTLLGGRAAEELVFDEPSTGSADDVAQATRLARRMVAELGMSDDLGPLAFTSADGPGGDWSSAVAGEVDREVQALVRQAMARALAIVRSNVATLVRLADELAANESIEGAALDAVLASVAPRPGPDTIPRLASAFSYEHMTRSPAPPG